MYAHLFPERDIVVITSGKARRKLAEPNDFALQLRRCQEREDAARDLQFE